MIVLTSMLRRLPHLTHEQFVAYHRGHHAPLFASTDAARKYVRRYTVEHPRPTRTPGLPASSFDAVVRMSFDSRADLARVFTSAAYLRLIRPDELRFFDHARSEFFLSEELVALDHDAPVPPLEITVPALNPPSVDTAAKKRLDPQPWKPPKANPGTPLPVEELELFNLSGHGAEDVAVLPDGRVVTGLVDGRIVALDPDTGTETTLADTGGRPLGIETHPDGGLIVCDAARGLLRVDPAGQVTTLVTEAAGQPLRFTNNAAVTAEGTIYFSDSSQRFGLTDWLGDALEHRPTGRLLRYTPDGPNGAVDVVADRLAFANGVALASDESFVVVAQTCAYDLQRITLTGPHQGDRGMFGEPLPGFPDNISTGQDGNLWVSLVAPRVPALDFLLPRHPRWRKLLWALPENLQPQGERPIHVRAYTPNGVLVHDLHTTHPGFGNATGARHTGQHVWLASIRHASLARFHLPGSTP